MLAKGILGKDCCKAVGRKRVYFHLDPRAEAQVSTQGDHTEVSCNGTRVRFEGGPGTWSVQESLHSPAYGAAEPTSCLVLESRADEILWNITLEERP